jgi:maleate isomerase
MSVPPPSAPPAATELRPATARIGLIIPSPNRVVEPQFHHFAPPGLGVHVARARIAGQWRRPLAEMADEIVQAADTLADCAPDLIVFHCTDSSMHEGLAGEARLIDLIAARTGIAAQSTSRMVTEALHAVGARSVVVLSPYANNTTVTRYLGESGISVVHDVALGIPSDAWGDVTPSAWLDLARDNHRAEAHAVFLSCINTRQIEAIAAIEQALGQPVVNSNQAVLWGAIERLRAKLPPVPPMPALGVLMTRPVGGASAP